eukprot:TRINITY_DN8197_c0_g1_i1.p2 TRINITY_DN8197_c0_g1~~TRINITY_DN8197_c0_g1_i1.p2  ORF type:complete len:257 (-),score=27.16 TRINITY_DN8197_c0_g1_i1:174-944(-)
MPSLVGSEMCIRDRYKTTLCRHFQNGNCTLGDKCYFAHGQQELRNANDPLPQNIPQLNTKVTVNNYRTTLCKYHEQGFCKNGANCNFAHGIQEIQQNQAKTQYQYATTPNLITMPAVQDPHIQILCLILTHLERVFASNSQVLQQLTQAQLFAKQGQTQEASTIILSIMNDPMRTEQEKISYNTIYTNAQHYYNQLCNQRTQAQPQFQNPTQPIQVPQTNQQANFQAQFTQLQQPQVFIQNMERINSLQQLSLIHI